MIDQIQRSNTVALNEEQSNESSLSQLNLTEANGFTGITHEVRSLSDLLIFQLNRDSSKGC